MGGKVELVALVVRREEFLSGDGFGFRFYIYTHIHTYIHIYTHIYTYIHIYTHIYTYTYIHTFRDKGLGSRVCPGTKHF